MANYTPTFEHIVIKGSKTALTWICRRLMALDVDFQFSHMEGFLSFVQADYGEGTITTLQNLIMDCPTHSWDIVNQFGCSYTSILHR
jgi:hypothetical protein